MRVRGMRRRGRGLDGLAYRFGAVLFLDELDVCAAKRLVRQRRCPGFSGFRAPRRFLRDTAQLLQGGRLAGRLRLFAGLGGRGRTHGVVEALVDCARADDRGARDLDLFLAEHALVGGQIHPLDDGETAVRAVVAVQHANALVARDAGVRIGHHDSPPGDLAAAIRRHDGRAIELDTAQLVLGDHQPVGGGSGLREQGDTGQRCQTHEAENSHDSPLSAVTTFPA